MRHVLVILAAALFAGCAKDEPTQPRTVTYWVQCQQCAVTYWQDGTHTDTVGWDWRSSLTAPDGQALTIRGVNLRDSGTVMVAIQVNGVLVDNDFAAWPDSVATISTP